METIWLNNKRFWRIVFNYNFPLVLWIGAAVLNSQGISLFDDCYVEKILGVCFGCGLTHDLVDLYSLGTTKGVLIYIVLFGFLLNFFYSIKFAHAKRSAARQEK
jgi:hypothetical protein